MGEQLLLRTGRAPLSFTGTLLYEESSSVGRRQRGGKEVDSLRWHEVALWQMGSKYVLHIAYRSAWRGEPSFYEAHILASPDEVEGFLDRHDCTAHVIGFPKEERYQQKQRALLADLQTRFRKMVSKLCFAEL